MQISGEKLEIKEFPPEVFDKPFRFIPDGFLKKNLWPRAVSNVAHAKRVDLLPGTVF